MKVLLSLRAALTVAVTAASVLAASPARAADDQAPDKSTGLSTNPATECAADPPSLVPDGDVTLDAPVSDPDGGGLDATFELSHGGSVIASPVIHSFSGSSARYRFSHDQLRAIAAGEITTVSWRARATDREGNLSPWSATCSFRYDPTRTTAPVVSSPGDTRIGQPVSVTVARGPGGVVPTSYSWQLNSSWEGGVVAADPSGAATITFTPRRFSNTLEVYGRSAAGNFGESTRVSFSSDPGAVADEGDLTGDRHTDLLVAGGDHGLPTGLWLARGDGAGGLAPTAVDLDPSDFSGTGDDRTQISIGRLTGGSFQDVLAYKPDRGGAVLFSGKGDGTPMRTANDTTILSPDLLMDTNGFNPIQLVRGTTQPGQTVPDLIGIAGSPDTGYYLDYYPSVDYTGGYPMAYSLAEPTPTGDLAWDTWTLAGTATTLFLWQKSSGKLYAWHDIAFDQETDTIAYNQQHLSDAWNTGRSVTLQAADINADDLSDLWTVGPSATATPWIISANGAMTEGAAQPIMTP